MPRIFWLIEETIYRGTSPNDARPFKTFPNTSW
jgi:hypothetical protein